MRTPLSLILHSNCETQLTFTEKNNNVLEEHSVL